MKSFPNAIDMLIADHQRVIQLFSNFETVRHSSRFLRASLSGAVCNALSVHLQIEEEIFYPTILLSMDEAEFLWETFLAHKKMREQIHHLTQISPDDEKFLGRVKTLAQYMDCHIAEEETQIFPRVNQSEINLVALGEQMMVRKMELEKAAKCNIAKVFARSNAG